MTGSCRVESIPATPAERAELLALMREELADRLDHIAAVMGLTWPEFEELYESQGEVRTLRSVQGVAGYCWIEKRDRELHLHAIFVLPDQRRSGVGSAALLGLEEEFRGLVDVMELGVERDNTGARALYARHGFEVAKVLPELGFEIMRKRLTGA